MRQHGDHGVAQTLAERTEELAVLHVVARVASQTLLTPLLLQLYRLKVPEQSEDRCNILRADWKVCK